MRCAATDDAFVKALCAGRCWAVPCGLLVLLAARASCGGWRDARGWRGARERGMHRVGTWALQVTGYSSERSGWSGRRPLINWC